jgi:ssDNA-binding Zn-finger/Zn-ribbon topoisomerase 1
MNWVIISGIVVLVVIVVIAVVGILLSRGKQLKCPDCENTFTAPIMEEKLTGLGYTLPYMGIVRCPKCGNKRSRRDYNKVERQTEKSQ